MSHTPGGAQELLPGTYQTAYVIAAAERQLYALRNDGAVFVLFKRGDMLPDGRVVHSPHWAHVPAVPGTIAALEQLGDTATAETVGSIRALEDQPAPPWWKHVAAAIVSAARPAELQPAAVTRAARRIAAELEVDGYELRRI